MSDWLDVAAPSGRFEAIAGAARDLTTQSRLMFEQADLLSAAAERTAADWTAQAAASFSATATKSVKSIRVVAQQHQDTAVTINDYAERWLEAENASARARRELEAVIDRYRRGAENAVRTLASILQNALDNAVGDILEHLFPAIRRAIARLRGWRAPVGRPRIHRVDRCGPPRSSGSLLEHIRSAGDWGISHLLDGLHAIADRIGGGIDAALDAFDAVERMLAEGVSRALRWAHDAVEQLWEFGQMLARRIKRFILDSIETVQRVVNQLIDVAITFARNVAQVLHLMVQIGAALASVAVILTRLGPGSIPPILLPPKRRIDAPRPADDAALLDYRTSPERREQVLRDRMLAAAAYAHAGEPMVLPPGWSLAERHDGAEGFSAMVFVNDETGEVVVAFRGSEFGGHFDAGDWSQDALNAAGAPTAQGLQAIALMQRVLADHPGAAISVTGHSLGGSLAAIASIATGVPATTFNAAGVGEGNHAAAMLAGGRGASEHQITNFHTTNDALTKGQRAAGVDGAAGAQVEVHTSTGNPFTAHGMESMDFERGPTRR